jgi:hypothetical protein
VHASPAAAPPCRRTSSGTSPAALAAVVPLRALAADTASPSGPSTRTSSRTRIYKHGSLGNPDPAIRAPHCATSSTAWRSPRRRKPRPHSLVCRRVELPRHGEHPPARSWFDRKAFAAVHDALSPDSACWSNTSPSSRPSITPTSPTGAWRSCWRAPPAPAKVLVDTGHHYQAQNIEQIVAWLLDEDMLGGFHFNDRRYADDDLTLGSIDPYQVFRIFHEIFYYAWETRRAAGHRVHGGPEPQPQAEDRGDDPDRGCHRSGTVREGCAGGSRKHPWGWNRAEFDDSTWKPAAMGRNGSPRDGNDGPNALDADPASDSDDGGDRRSGLKAVRGQGVRAFMLSVPAPVPAGTAAVLLDDNGALTTAFPELRVQQRRRIAGRAEVHRSTGPRGPSRTSAISRGAIEIEGKEMLVVRKT